MAVVLKRLLTSLNHSKYNLFRNIMTTSSKCEKAMENLKSNPYYEKYSDRIAKLQKSSPEEFLKRVEGTGINKKTEKKKNYDVDTRQFSYVHKPKPALKDEEDIKDKKLSDIFKVELVADKDAEEVQVIWEEYHKDKEVISATIPKDVYSKIQTNMNQFSTFLLPLPRAQGYELIMLQCDRHTVHFTPLLAFQIHKENAPECLTMVHYTELSEKGIVLMRGEYDKNVLNGKEAQCLANMFQMYYGGRDQKKIEMLETFTKTPDKFKYTDLIADLQKIELA